MSFRISLDFFAVAALAPGPHLIAAESALDSRPAEGQRDLLGFDQLLGDAFLAQGGSHRIAETLDDRLRRTRRRKDAPPGVGFETGKATLGHGWHLGDELIALFPGLYDRTNCPSVDLWHR